MFIHLHSLRHLLRPEHFCSAQHFQPEPEQLLRLESCGDPVFVSINPDAIRLREYPSSLYEETERSDIPLSLDPANVAALTASQDSLAAGKSP